MAEESKNYMPRLRFPEFRGPTTWEISPLNKIIKTIIPPKKILTQEYEKGGKIPIIDQSKEKIAGYTNDLSSVIKINKPVIVFGDHTCIIKYIDFDFAQGADGIKIIEPINIIPRYLFEYLCYFPVNPTGYSRHFSILKEKSIGFPPSIKEQQKIADCLSSLDELLQAHEQKRDALVEHKKGLMQRLFPAEGETTPRWRFPEFRKGTEWETASLNTLVKTITPPKKIPTDQYERSGKIPVIDQSKEKISGHTNDIEAKISIKSPVIIFGDHTCILKYIDFDFAQGADGIKILRPLNIIPRFLYEYLCFSPVIPTGYSRHFSILKEKNIYFPAEVDEQQKIADCLSSLDSRIEAEEAKIAALREHKQGLMQRLFPQSL